jgi:hypothetical protein
MMMIEKYEIGASRRILLFRDGDGKERTKGGRNGTYMPSARI